MAGEQMNFAEAFLDPKMGLRGRLKAMDELIDWAPVETVFGSLKRLYRRARMRYRNVRHNLADMYRVMTVFNMRRAVSLAGM